MASPPVVELPTAGVERDRVTSAPDPVDWKLAVRVARRVAGREPLAASYLADSLRRDFTAVTIDAEALVTEFTGLCPRVRAAASCSTGSAGSRRTSSRCAASSHP